MNAAVDVLEALGVVSVDRSGRANGVQIDPAMLVKAHDPITTIPQAEYHTPVRKIVTELTEQLGQEIGIVLFGSVARGTADRTSDIDLFVVVDKNRRQAQREAHRIERKIANTSIDGDRYEAHIIVEPSTSAGTHDRIREILTEGLTLRDSPALKTVKQEVFHSGSQ
ncbi:nucleotidyltransferase domain-containing protein [Halorubrum sp. SD690R]|uniref:nucleotidyltransferase domain-containing protein n=1 Tax=Halorubrum sp. SD690R TaxID=2518117 RepID=UPI001F5468AC|nr:nucleotidyltransferase domain-containing protein [Halorubrum sp. SD690R]